MNLKATLRKPSKASSLFENRKLGLIVMVVILGLIFLYVQMDDTLVISNQETGEVYVSYKVSSGDKLTYKWIHSFEHIPWIEDYEIMQDSSLALKEIRVAGFGAGIPEDKGVMTIENGMVVMRELNDRFDDIHWFNSHTALQYIAVNDHIIIRGSDMPHHKPLILQIKGRNFKWQKSHKMP